MADCTITVKGNRAYIVGAYPSDAVLRATSYPVKGAHFNQAYKRGHWDGRKHLFDKKTQSFGAGLVGTVLRALKALKVDVEVVDNTPAPPGQANGFDLKTIEFGVGKYDYQLGAVKAMLAHRRGIVKIATNGGKSSICAALAQHLGLPTLILVPGIDLLHQTARVFCKYLDLPTEDIGLIGDGEYRIGKQITIAVMDSVVSKIQAKDENFMAVKDNWMLVIVDECHVSGSDTAFEALDALPAPLRYGVSGTPMDRSDGATVRLLAQTGDIIFEVSNKTLVERGISVQPKLELMTIRTPVLPKNMSWADVNDLGVVNNKELNEKLVRRGHQLAMEGKQVIYLVDKIAQGDNIVKLLENCKPDYKFKFMNGSMSSAERKQCLTDFADDKIRVLIGTSILNTGIDLPNIDVMVFCAGGKATIPTLQRAGRGLRAGRGRDSVLIIDFCHFGHKILTKHSKERLKTFKSQDCFEISVSEYD